MTLHLHLQQPESDCEKLHVDVLNVLPEEIKCDLNRATPNILKAQTFIIKASGYIWKLGQVLYMCVMNKAHLQDLTQW